MKTLHLPLAAGIIMVLSFSRIFAIEPIIKLDNIRPEKIEMAGFELTAEQNCKIEAVGLRGYDNDYFAANGWILNSLTRETIWVMDNKNSERHGRHGLAKAEETVLLKPGKYELYYYAGTGWGGNIMINGRTIINLLGDLFDGDINGDIDDYIDDFYIAVYPQKDDFKDFKLFEPDGRIPGALLQLNKIGDSEYIQKGFSLNKNATLRIYTLLEFPRGYKAPVDNAWIVNADTRDKVWEADRWNTDPAGGGEKNKVANEEIKFDKGNYILYYVTDDSHSYDDFNVSPPYDPLNWGVALIAAKDSDKNAFSLFEPKGRGTALIDLTGAGNDEFLSQAFQLKSDQTIHIYCLGEYSSGGREFVDYGWIENADNGKTVWEMTRRNTAHAGGASKNRMFDGVVDLDKGHYIAHFITDDSHSSDRFNASPPFEPKAWGLAIYPGKDFDNSKFVLLKESELKSGANILVKMTGLRDHERKRAKFKLDKQTKILIYAIGEGSRDEMYDYGWIVSDETGRSVWEMTWRNTEPAGGASKNRLFNDTILLQPGDYIVNFITDASHSFNDWNASKPRDPVNWGITVSIEK